jgi:tetratricopeptide (TPR) repeat protein
MNPMPLPLSLCLLLLFPSICPAGESEEFIEMLTQDIMENQISTEKSRLHIYRARQYSKINEWEKALEDYNKALELSHKGWIHLERSHFFMNQGQYALAYEDARAAKKEVPTLAREADKIIEAAGAEIQKKYDAENPITIVMDSKVDPTRKTRFDVMRTQGVFAANAAKTENARQQRMAAKKQQLVAVQTPKKSRG